LFYLSLYSVHRQHQYSFPTRRSSDLKKNMSIPLTVVGDTNGDLKLASTLPEKTLFGISVLPAGSLCGTSKFDMKSTFTIDYYTGDRKSTRLNSSHVKISYAVFCLKKK